MTLTSDSTASTSTDSVTSAHVSFTDSTITISSTNLMATTPSNDAEQELNDDSGGGVGGIVAGCIVAFILIIAIVVCLIIFLIWYRAKKKGEYTTEPSMAV